MGRGGGGSGPRDLVGGGLLVRPKQRAAERPGWPTASRGAAHAAKGLALGLAEVAVLTVAVVGMKAFVPVEALGSLYVLAVLPIAIGWGFAWRSRRRPVDVDVRPLRHPSAVRSARSPTAAPWHRW